MKNIDAVSRRNFMKTTASTIALTAAQYRSLTAHSANDKIVLGLIGAGGMGNSNMNSFLREDDVEFAGICDVDSSHAEQTADKAERRQNKRPDTYHDFRMMLERDDIDAVVIATPDHWHAITFLHACEAGKDIYVEKPLSKTIDEGRKMRDTAMKYKRVVQLGNIIHNDHNTFRRVVELVQSGNLGKITRVHVWKQSKMEGLGYPKNCEPPKELDYEFWLGPAPEREYNPNRSHFTFRYFWDYSGGMFIDFWCHITDVAYWALALDAPQTVSAIGGKFHKHGNSETPDVLEVQFEFPELVMAWSLHPKIQATIPEMGNIGCAFEGTNGTLVTNYTKNVVYVDGKIEKDFPRPEPSIPDSPGHRREFLNCIKSREKTTCNIEYAHKLTKGGHLGNIAYRTGEKIVWDDEHERAVGSRDANKLVKGTHRRPWTV